MDSDAREGSGLSQRDLSARIGVPQSHLSKIESCGTDLRLSSLASAIRRGLASFALAHRI